MPNYILYFGSFSPVHNGHIRLAESILDEGLGREVWFVLSPQNPFKQNSGLWTEDLRRKLLEEALRHHPRLKFCGIELELPKPSFTIQTLLELRHRHPEKEFDILMGEDNLEKLHLWKDYRRILEMCHIYVYPRAETHSTLINMKACGLAETEKPDSPTKVYPAQSDYPNKIHRLELPLLNISSSEIRQMLQEGKDIAHLVPFPTELIVQ